MAGAPSGGLLDPERRLHRWVGIHHERETHPAGKVVCPPDAVEPVDEEGPEPKKAPAEPKVISLADLKKTPT